MTKSEMIKAVIRMLMEMEEWEKGKQGVTPLPVLLTLPVKEPYIAPDFLHLVLCELFKRLFQSLPLAFRWGAFGFWGIPSD